MKRRGFFKAIGQAVAVVALAPRLCFGAPKMEGLPVPPKEEEYFMVKVFFEVDHAKDNNVESLAWAFPVYADQLLFTTNAINELIGDKYHNAAGRKILKYEVW